MPLKLTSSSPACLMSSHRSTPLSSITGPGEVLNMLLTRVELLIDATQKQSMAAQVVAHEQLLVSQEQMLAIQAETLETRQTLEEARSKLNRLEMSSAMQMIAGQSSNPGSNDVGAVTCSVTAPFPTWPIKSWYFRKK